MSKSQREEKEVKELLEEQYVLNAIAVKLWTEDQKKILKEIKKLLSAIGKEVVDDVLKEIKKNEKEVKVIKLLEAKNTILEIAPKSRTDQQKKDLQRYNRTLQRIAKKTVGDVGEMKKNEE